jgi:hypothetical protein
MSTRESSTAQGTFEVKLTPRPAENLSAAGLMAMTIDKQFRGDLEATSQGEMLSAGTAVKGSAGYVALEKVTGRLQGRNGSFVLQHSGTLNRGVPQLSISVVPDSGSGELIGLEGEMAIEIADGRHSYTFQFSLGVLEFA